MKHHACWVVLGLVLTAAGGPAAAEELGWTWDFGSAAEIAACSVKPPLKAEAREVEGTTCLALVGDFGDRPLKGRSNTVLSSDCFPLRSRWHYRLTSRLKVTHYELGGAPSGRGPGRSSGRPKAIYPPVLGLQLGHSRAGALASLRRVVGSGNYYASPVAPGEFEDQCVGKWQDLVYDFFVTREMDQGMIELALSGEGLTRFELLIDFIKLESVVGWPEPPYLEAKRPQLSGDTVARREVDLRVAGWPNGTKAQWPLCSGIPLPRGELVDEAHTQLTDSRGRPVPTQTTAFDRWDDGSVRWLLVDVPAESAQDRFVLEYGHEVEPVPLPSRLRVTETADRIEVDTGPLQFAVRRRGFDLFDSFVSRGRQLLGAGDRLTLVTADGVSHRAAGDPGGTVRVERSWPRHAVIVATGWLAPTRGKPRFAYVARLDAYEGQDFVTLAFTFINKSDADREGIKAASVRLPFASAVQGWNLCGVEGRGAGWLLQDKHDHFSTSEDDEGKRSNGRAVLGLDDARVQLAVRDWWQNYAKGFEVEETSLRVDLWPGRLELPYLSRQGEAKTHELLIRVCAPDAETDAAFACFDALPQLVATPEWNCESKAAGEMLPAPGSPWPWFDEGFARGVEVILERREKRGFYGMRDFGDQTRGELRDEWDNNSRDLSLSLYQQYLRTGEIRYLRLGRQMQLHQMDTDTIHHSPRNPERLGATYCQARNPNHREKQPSPTFTSIGGQLLYAALTGDERARRLSLRSADFVTSRAGRGGAGYSYCARHNGWPMATILSAYEARWEPKYLAAAERLLSCVAAAASSRDQVGTFRWGGRRVAWGYLVYALHRFYAHTGDGRAPNAILKIIDHRVDVGWRPDLGGFIFDADPKRLKMRGRLSYRAITELPLAYTLSPRQKYLDVFAANLRDVQGHAGPALAHSQKHFSWATRFPPLYFKRYLQIGAPLAEAGPDLFLSDDRKAMFSASDSRPIGGHRIVKYEWDLGDGHRAEGERVSHTYAEARDYTVTLTCTSSSGAAARDTTRVRALLPGGESVRNGGFETDADGDGRPDHWRFMPRRGDARAVLDSSVARSGKRSIRIEGPGADFALNMVQLDRPLKPDTVYVFSCWVKLAKVEFLPRVSPRQAIRFWVSSDPPLMRGSAFAVEEPGTTDWKRYEKRFKSKPRELPVAVTSLFQLRKGTVWVDDLSLSIDSR